MSQKGRFCCKSRFALVTENSAGRGRGFRVKMCGTSSPRDKLTGDFGNAIEVIRIGDYFPFRLFAKNLLPFNFRVLQHTLPLAEVQSLADSGLGIAGFLLRNASACKSSEGRSSVSRLIALVLLIFASLYTAEASASEIDA